MFITRIARAFNLLSPRHKARWIAAVCAVAAVLTGFVLFIALKHAFTGGDLALKIAGLAGGILVALAAGALVDWLRHTIDTGRADLRRLFGKMAFTAVVLVAAFELCVSSMEDFTKATVGEFGEVRRIAARITGHAEGPELTRDNSDLAGLARAMREALEGRQPGAARRLGRLLDVEHRVLLFDAVPDSEMRALWTYLALTLSPPASFDGQTMPWVAACRAAVPSSRPPRGSASASLLRQPAPDLLGVARQVDTDDSAFDAWSLTCRDRIRQVAAPARLSAIERGLKRVLARHDFYDPADLDRRDSEGRRLLPEDDAVLLVAREQRLRCDAIRGPIAPPPGEVDSMDCTALVRMDVRRASDARLLPVGQMSAINREILARLMPELVEGQSVAWSDLVVLVSVWTIAAVVLAVLLSDSVFATTTSGSVRSAFKPAYKAALVSLVVAPASLGVAVVAIRAFGFVRDLMFAPPPPAESLFAGGMLAAVTGVVPWVVNWMKAGGPGMPIPGWITLPLAVGTLVWTSVRTHDSPSRGLAIWTIAGIVAVSVAPVLDGIVGLMLLVGMTWLVPALGLATLLPYLEPAAPLPRWWGVIAIVAAAILGAWTVIATRHLDPGMRLLFAVATAVVATTGAFILRRSPVRRLAPLIAITVAFTLLGATAVLRELTFQGALRQLHPLTTRSATAPERAALARFFLGDQHEAPPDVPERARLDTSADDVREAGRLELALVGALGFWLTIALLAAWSLRFPRTAGRPAGGEASG